MSSINHYVTHYQHDNQYKNVLTGKYKNVEIFQTDCFIICYSVNDRKSFENVYDRWLPEIIKHGDGPIVPILLACKERTDRNQYL